LGNLFDDLSRSRCLYLEQNVSFDCTDLAMVTADNNLVFLGGTPEEADMKVVRFLQLGLFFCSLGPS
jgi:hypothetical protein